MLDRVLEYLKKLSIVASIIAGSGLLLLYGCGIAIYSSLYSFLGIEPFSFHLAGCLEHGSQYVGELSVLLPTLLLPGIKDLVQDFNIITFLVLILPIALICLAGPLAWRLHERTPKVALTAVILSLWLMCLILIVVYFVTLMQFTATNLLLDPAVNTALHHQDELRNGVPPGDLGIWTLDRFTISTIFDDDSWNLRKLGRIIVIGALTGVWAFVLLWISARLVDINGPQHRDLRECLVVSRRITYLTTLVFVAGFLFAVPGRTAVVAVSMSSPRVDVSIPGFKIAEQNYLIQAAEYEDRYAFYVPTQQSVVVVPKSSVAQMVVKENISPFANRNRFVKGPWLGVEDDGKWKQSIVNGVSVIEGFEVTSVTPESPAYKGGILVGDVLTAIGSIPIDGTQEVCEIVHRMPAIEPISVTLARSQKVIILKVPFELRP
jgi:hypothetical protein